MPKVYTMPDDRIEKVAIWGTATPTDQQRAAYETENDLTFAGTPDEVSEYITGLEAEIAAAPVVEPELPAVPSARATIYDEMATLLGSLGITEIPADYDAAIAALEAVIDTKTTVAASREALKVANRILARRVQLMEIGGSWEEALRYFSGG